MPNRKVPKRKAEAKVTTVSKTYLKIPDVMQIFVCVTESSTLTSPRVAWYWKHG